MSVCGLVECLETDNEVSRISVVGYLLEEGRRIGGLYLDSS